VGGRGEGEGGKAGLNMLKSRYMCLHTGHKACVI